MQPKIFAKEPCLPDGWQLVDSLLETIDLKGCKIHSAGFAAQRLEDQQIVTGSSVSWNSHPQSIAFYELLERIAILNAMGRPDSEVWPIIDGKNHEKCGVLKGVDLFPRSPEPDLWQYSRSNGVAMGPSLAEAFHSALCEAVERHLVLASWYGFGAPIPRKCLLPPQLLALANHYRTEQYSFGELAYFNMGISITAAMTVLWPHDTHLPAIYGFGAASSMEDAQLKSCKEAVQRLAFLYDAEPTQELNFAPVAEFHQDFFLQQEQQPTLRQWLNGSFQREPLLSRQPHAESVSYVEIADYSDRACYLVKVLDPGLLPLCFGKHRPSCVQQLTTLRMIHPIA